MGQTDYKENDVRNKANIEERLIQSLRGVGKGIVCKTIDKKINYYDVECFDFSDSFVHSLACIVDGDGTVFIKIVKNNGEEHRIRVLTSDSEFDEIFGDITHIEIAATCPYRAVIRR